MGLQKKMLHNQHGNLNPLGKSYHRPESFLRNQYVIEQAASPARYRRERLFTLIFAEIKSWENRGPGMKPTGRALIIP
jgi:hypothetical protein